MSKDPAPHLAVIRPAVQRHRETGLYCAVVHVAAFATREEAANAAKVLCAAAVEKFASVGVKPGPAVN